MSKQGKNEISIYGKVRLVVVLAVIIGSVYSISI
jgi:hypothetical protein